MKLFRTSAQITTERCSVRRNRSFIYAAKARL